MPEKAAKGIGPKGHLALKSSALCTTDCKLVSQLLVQDHMAAHYKKLSKVKSAIDTTPPKTWSGSQKMRDQARRAAIKDGRKTPQTKKNNYTGWHSPMNTSRTSSDAAREEMMAMLESLNEDEDFPDGFLPGAGRAQKDESTLEANAPGSSVNMSLDDVGNMHTMPHYKSNQSRRATFQRAKSVEVGTLNRNSRMNGTVRQPAGYRSLDETSRGNLTKRGNTMQFTRSGDILDSHTQKFTERKPFTPMTLKTNSKSKLLEFKYYNRPPPKKDMDRTAEDDMYIPRGALGRTMHYPRNKPVPKMTTESDIMLNETLQSRGDFQVTPTGVPPLNISLDPDHINWLQEQSKKSSSRRGHQSHADLGSELGSTQRPTYRPNTGLRPSKSLDLKTSLAGNNTLTLDKVQETGEEEDDIKYLEFVSDVTNDVLDRGIFTNRALLQVFEAHIQKNKDKLDVKKMYSMLEDLRIDLGIPSDKESTDSAFGDTLTNGRDMTKTGDTEFNYNESTTLTHVTPLEQNTLSNTRNTNLNDYGDDTPHAFKPISANQTPIQSRKNSYQSDKLDNEFGTRGTPVKSRTPTLSGATSRKNSYQSDLDSKDKFSRKNSYQSDLDSKDKFSRKNSHHSDLDTRENNPIDKPDNKVADDDDDRLSDTMSVSSKASLGKTTMKFDSKNFTQKPGSIDEEDGYDDVDTARKSELSDDDKEKQKEDDDDDTKCDDDKYDDDKYEDDYEAETARTQNDEDDYDTIKSNYEKIQKGSISERSENDVYGQSDVESTNAMKAVIKSDNESDH